MPRGQASQVGDTMVNQNGYHNTKTEEGWRLTHHIIAEEKLGRPVESTEYVRFIDGDRRNLDPDNIEVVLRATVSLRSRLAVIEFKLQELQAEKKELEARLARGERKLR